MSTTITYRFPGTRRINDKGCLRSESKRSPRDVVYEFRDNSVIVSTRENGILAVDRRALRALAAEML